MLGIFVNFADWREKQVRMIDALLHLAVLVTAVWGLFRGYRKGFTGQVASVLGLAFGAVASHAFGEEVTLWLREVWSAPASAPASEFIYSLVGFLLVFGATFAAFGLLGKILASVMDFFKVDVLNGVAGAFFCAFKYLFILSVVYNLAGGIFPHSRLMRYAQADDGNLVEVVMLLAPGVMGSLDCEDLHHMIQLRDAKTIS